MDIIKNALKWAIGGAIVGNELDKRDIAIDQLEELRKLNEGKDKDPNLFDYDNPFDNFEGEWPFGKPYTAEDLRRSVVDRLPFNPMARYWRFVGDCSSRMKDDPDLARISINLQTKWENIKDYAIRNNVNLRMPTSWVGDIAGDFNTLLHHIEDLELRCGWQLLELGCKVPDRFTKLIAHQSRVIHDSDLISLNDASEWLFLSIPTIKMHIATESLVNYGTEYDMKFAKDEIDQLYNNIIIIEQFSYLNDDDRQELYNASMWGVESINSENKS